MYLNFYYSWDLIKLAIYWRWAYYLASIMHFKDYASANDKQMLLDSWKS